MIPPRLFLSVCLSLQLILISVPLWANSITAFTLINADNNTVIMDISQGTTIILDTLPSTNINIRAVTSPATVTSVTFSLSGATSHTQTESVAPYALWGDSSGNYNAASLNTGAHTLTATPKTGTTSGTPLAIDFTVTQTMPGMPVADAGPDQYIFLPEDSIMLIGSGTDYNGSITAYQWTLVSGPNNATIEGETTETVSMSGCIRGTYTMEFTVTDNDGNSDSDQVLVRVSEQSTTSDIYLEDNGILIMEAENGVAETVDKWIVATDIPDYKGDGFIRWENDNFFSDRTHGILSYTFRISNGGTYHLRLRSFHDPAVHNETNDQENDCWTNYSLNSTTSMYKTFRNSGQAGQPWSIAGTWEPTHATFETPKLTIQPGDYTFRIAARSKYFMIDRIYLVQDTSDLQHDLPESQTIVTQPIITGELKKWHKVTLTFDGPQSSETATPNPFTDYRFDVIFSNGSASYTVPGYFAADGNAGESGATSGSKWRVHFAPDRIGTWNYTVLFHAGANIIDTADPSEGTVVSLLHGMTGSFDITDTDKTGRDHRGKGMLQYVGKHYLQFAETGEYFLKQGADAPENFLAYDDFDNTPDNGGRRKSWSAHIGDWNTGDPTWQGDKGKGMIGAINYLASEGMNAFSFIPMNIEGDDKNVFPYISDQITDRNRMDCSKLDQWEIVFEHADAKGMFLHFKTQETENELLLDSGNLGVERKLYYRELIARFGHHLALNWNLGEEINNATTAQKKSWAQYFHDNDPYKHHIVIHNMGDPHYDLLGSESKLTGFSLQTGSEDFSQVHSRVKDYITRSADAGKPWAVACDEPGDASHSLRPDNDAGNSHEDARKNGLWGTFMAGGWGNEWYFGYKHDHSDLTCEDFRSRDAWWDYSRFALSFFNDNNIPFWEMENDNSLSSANSDYCFLKDGEVYVIYLKDGGTTDLDLEHVPGKFEVQWFNPRTGGNLQNGSKQFVDGNATVNLGSAPDSTDKDWVILVRHDDNIGYTLKDAVIGLQVLSGLRPLSSDVTDVASLATDNTISLAQVIQIMQELVK